MPSTTLFDSLDPVRRAIFMFASKHANSLAHQNISKLKHPRISEGFHPSTKLGSPFWSILIRTPKNRIKMWSHHLQFHARVYHAATGAGNGASFGMYSVQYDYCIILVILICCLCIYIYTYTSKDTYISTVHIYCYIYIYTWGLSIDMTSQGLQDPVWTFPQRRL